MNPLAKMMGSQSPGLSGITPQAVQQVKQMAGAFQAMRNPQAALMQMAQQNPQIAGILQMCQGKTPKDVFSQECRDHGIDPDQAFKQIQDLLNQ